MSKFLSALTLYLLSSPLFAATKEMEAVDAAGETVSMVWVVIFVILFVGSIVGFFIYMWISEKKNKTEK